MEQVENYFIRNGISLAALLTGLLGISVIFGWYINSSALVQVLPQFAPMQYNTALGFVLAAAGLLAINLRRFKTGFALGFLVALIGLLTITQYLFRLDFGIDQIFMDHTIMTKTSHPGRMAPNTALCFSLCGTALMVARIRRSLMFGFAISILIFATLALLGYMVHGETLYGWGNLTRMAIHTAADFIVLSSALIVYGLFRARIKYDLWRLAPFSLATVIAILSCFSWYAVDEEAEARNLAYFDSLVSDTQAALIDRYERYEQSLWSGLGLYYASESVERQEWHAFVSALDVKNSLPGINGIGYIDYVKASNLGSYLNTVRETDLTAFKNHPDTDFDDKFIIKYIEPVDINEAAVGLDIGFEANRREAAERARDLGVPALTRKILLVQDQKHQAGFLLLLPHYSTNNVPETEELRRKHFLGWVYAPFIGPNFLDDLSNYSRNQLDFEVFDGLQPDEENLIYRSSEVFLERSDNKMSKTSLNFAGRDWTIQWYANNAFIPPAGKALGFILLLFGLALSGFLYIVLSILLSSKDVIAQKVEERTRDLQEANEELERSNNELERFAYIASHDLQEPLRKIGGFANRLEAHFDEGLDEKAQTYMNFITDGVTRMRELIMGLLAYSKVSTAESTIQALDVNDVVKVAVDNISEMVKENNATINYKDLPNIQFDKVMLTQLFQNLINNAIKYRSDDDPVIQIDAKKEKEGWWFSVSDNGMGMEEKYLERIFEMFQRLHRKEEISGTGIGLSLCQKIVERYGGEIKVTSEPGKGSTFFFTILDDLKAGD